MYRTSDLILIKIVVLAIAFAFPQTSPAETVPTRYNGLNRYDCLVGNKAINDSLKPYDLTIVKDHGATAFRKAGDPAIYFIVYIYCLKTSTLKTAEFDIETPGVLLLKTVGDGLGLVHAYIGEKDSQKFIDAWGDQIDKTITTMDFAD
jgi:hypothetical protein